jgi:hypothetical protein
MDERVQFLGVTKQIIKSFLIGIGITAFGGLVCFIDMFIYDGTAAEGTFGDVCLVWLVKIFCWPVWAAIKIDGDMGESAIPFLLLIPTAFFWGVVVECFRRTNKKAKDASKIPTS